VDAPDRLFCATISAFAAARLAAKCRAVFPVLQFPGA
jgi:hypothetical protein